MRPKGAGTKGHTGGLAAPPPLRPPYGKRPQPQGRLVAVALFLLVAYYAARAAGWLPQLGAWSEGRWPAERAPEAVRTAAVDRMARGLAVLARERERRGIPIDRSADPNGTGVIGEEFTVITTTLGDPVAKRTATNPQWAAVLADLLWQAGVREGDLVAAGLSGSFPGLNLALFAAVAALDGKLAAVASLGASMWGANIPGWTWADMELALAKNGLIEQRSLAFSLGGGGDGGEGLAPGGVALLREAARSAGAPLLEATTLQEAVDARMALFDAAARRAGRPIRVYVNVGGGQASFGRCTAVLELPPGLSMPERIPLCGMEAGGRTGAVPGVISRMAARGVPVVHLLNIRELAVRSGLPIDPVPLPASASLPLAPPAAAVTEGEAGGGGP